MSVAATNLTTNGSSADSSSYSTASISPGTNKLIVAVIVEGASAAPGLTSISGVASAWSQLGSVTLGNRRMYLYTPTTGATVSPGTITFNFSGTPIGCVWSVLEFSGVKSSNWIVNSGSGSNSAAVGYTRALSAALKSNENALVGFFFSNRGTVAPYITPSETITDVTISGAEHFQASPDMSIAAGMMQVKDRPHKGDLTGTQLFGTFMWFGYTLELAVDDRAAITTLSDNFNDNSIDDSKWASPSSGQVAETGGKLQITTTFAAAAQHYLETDVPYAFLNANIMWRWPPLAEDAALSNTWVAMQLLADDGAGGHESGFMVRWHVSGSGDPHLQFMRKINGGSWVAIGTAITYDPVAMKYLRINMTATTAAFSYSSDGKTTWIQHASVTLSNGSTPPIGALKPRLVAGTDAAEDHAYVFSFDNVNVTPLKVLPTAITNTSSLGTPTARAASDIAPDSIVNTSEVPSPAAALEYGLVLIPPIESTIAFGDTFVSNEIRTVYPEAIESTESFGTLIIGHELQVVRPTTINNRMLIEVPSVNGELAPNDTAPNYPFYALTHRALRDIAAAIRISFNRGYDPDTDFYTVGESAFDDGSVFKGDGSTVQEWDKFDFQDFTNELSSYEYHYEQDLLGSMVLGYADFTLRNFDDRFSPFSGSDLSDNIAANRPVRLYAGFRQNLYQLFVGQTVRLPKTDQTTAKFHAIDFIASFAEIELVGGRVYTDVRWDEVIDDILQNDAGLSPTQYELDEGIMTVDFLHVPAGTKIGELFREGMEAEGGKVYQAHDGTIYFKNRENMARPTAITLREDYVYNQGEPEEGTVINRVKINADVREVQPQQQVYPALKDGSLTEYEDFQPFIVKAGETIEKFFNFKEPATTVEHPTIGSGLEATTNQDGTGGSRNSDLGFTASSTFTDAVKYTFENVSGSDFYISELIIEGTPARVVNQIRVDVKDQPSIDKYGEKLHEINNDYFNDQAYALEVATNIVEQNKDAPSIRELTIKGIPYLATGDIVKLYDGTDNVVDWLTGKMSAQNGFTQQIRVRLVS